jgi:hypothetical protein
VQCENLTESGNWTKARTCVEWTSGSHENREFLDHVKNCQFLRNTLHYRLSYLLTRSPLRFLVQCHFVYLMNYMKYENDWWNRGEVRGKIVAYFKVPHGFLKWLMEITKIVYHSSWCSFRDSNRLPPAKPKSLGSDEKSRHHNDSARGRLNTITVSHGTGRPTEIYELLSRQTPCLCRTQRFIKGRYLTMSSAI